MRDRCRSDLSDPRRELHSKVLAALICLVELRDPPFEGSLLAGGELALRIEARSDGSQPRCAVVRMPRGGSLDVVRDRSVVPQ
jgi:hypothetical protein